MVKVDNLSFGAITIGGRKYRRDLLLFPDGTLKRRKGGFWIFGSHNIKREEVEELTSAGAEEIVVGTGTNGRARLSDEAKSYVEQAKLQINTLPSHDAIPEFNRLVDAGKKVAALIHITC